MKKFNKIAFILDGFELRTPGQQLLDRFLIGYQHNGGFGASPKDRKVIAFCPRNEETNRRVEKHGLSIANSIAEAAHDVDAIVTVSDETATHLALQSARADTPIFAYGKGVSREILSFATNRKIPLETGSVALSLFRLPGLENLKTTHLREALVVVPGEMLEPELRGLDGLFSFFDASARKVRFVSGNELWTTVNQPLLSAALSRSDKPLGHAVEDGRTEDLVGLGLVQKLAKSPRGWQLQHRDNFHSTILILDGVVGDMNIAFRTLGGRIGISKIVSTQLFHSPSPQEEHYSRLTSTILDFFQTGKVPWSSNRTLAASQLLRHFANPSSRGSDWKELS